MKICDAVHMIVLVEDTGIKVVLVESTKLVLVEATITLNVVLIKK